MPFELVLRYQAGIVTRAQAHGSGLSDRAIAHRVATGRWQRVHLGVYAAFSGPLSRQAVVGQPVASQLRCPPR